MSHPGQGSGPRGLNRFASNSRSESIGPDVCPLGLNTLALSVDMDVFAAQVQAMMRPETYPIRVHRVTQRPTHMAVVFLTERHAWKLRRPLQRGLMDFRTAQARHQDACNEWELDEHFAPGVCVGLTALRLDPAKPMGWSLGWAGPSRAAAITPCLSGAETVLCMHRLPAAGMLDHLVRNQMLSSAQISACVRTLAIRLAARRSFPVEPLRLLHEHRRTGSDLVAWLHQSRYAQSPPQLDRISTLLSAALERHRAGIAHRARAGWIRDGHGDLRPEHVCLKGSWVREHGPAFIDALEFDAGLRRLDALDEIAGLAVSCEFLGSAWAHRELRRAWQAIDPLATDGLWGLCAGRIALMRALHAAWHLDSPRPPHETDLWRARSAAWLQLAEGHLRRSMIEG